MQKILLFFTFLSLIFLIETNAQTTSIPDVYFEQALIDLGYDSGIPDGIIATSIIDTIDSLDINTKNITDISGIENFTSLVWLDCSYNSITTIDLSNNLNLEYLSCRENFTINNLNVSQNINLKVLDCDMNNLQNIDISNNINLTAFTARLNQLTTIDLSSNTLLDLIGLSWNQLNSIDVSNNTSLTNFDIGFNSLYNLDLSNNLQLILLSATSCNLSDSTLNISQNLLLQKIFLISNNFESLDFSSYPYLSHIVVQDCEFLKCLNLRNGNNANISNQNFLATFNPQLFCIQVDDSTYSTNTWLNIDSQAFYDTNCNYNCDISTGLKSESSIYDFTIKPNPSNGILNIIQKDKSKFYTYEIFSMEGRSIIKGNSSNPFHYINISNHIKGIYFLKIYSENSSEIHKFILN